MDIFSLPYVYETKCNKTWELYSQQRNHVTKLTKKSENVYFSERCIGGSKSTDFWTTIKPYFSKKAADNKCKIVLNEEGTLVTETSKVSEIFNEIFTHVADSIGKDFVFTPETHPSIMKIKENYENVDTFNFKVIEDTVVDKIIRSLSSKKAVGADKISAKLLKADRVFYTFNNISC